MNINPVFKIAVLSITVFSSIVSSEGWQKRVEIEEDIELMPLFPQLKRAKISGEEEEEDEYLHHAVDIAEEILKIDQTEQRAHIPVDPLKLQKLLYYIQGYHLSLYNIPIFTDDIVHFTYGPLIWAVYNKFKGLAVISSKKGSLEKVPSRKKRTFFTPEQAELIKTVFQLKMTKSGSSLVSDTHSERPYKETHNNDVMENQLLAESFREVEIWLPLIGQRFMAADSNEKIQELISYVRAYISYSALTSDDLDIISGYFQVHRGELERCLIHWTSSVAVKWPHQSLFHAFMGHIFFPLQYELLYETTAILNTRESLQILITQAACYGNLLALYHAGEIIKFYILISPEKKEADVKECSNGVDYLPEHAKKLFENVKNTTGSETLPPYFAGLLFMYLNNAAKATKLFYRGYELGAPLCVFRYALSLKNLEKRQPYIETLKRIDKALGLFAEDSPRMKFEERYQRAIESAQLGYEGGYHLAGVIAETKKRDKEAFRAFILASRHHILGDYEKVAQGFETQERISEMLKTFEIWGKAGDSRGYVKLGEWYLQEYKKGGEQKNKENAWRFFKQAGLRGLEKQIEHADTHEQREYFQKMIYHTASVMQDILTTKIIEGLKAT